MHLSRFMSLCVLPQSLAAAAAQQRAGVLILPISYLTLGVGQAA